MKVVILGSGASRNHGYDFYPKPPLASGFFSEDIISSIPYIRSNYSKLLSYIKCKCVAADSNIETIYKQLEPIWELGVYNNRSSVKKYSSGEEQFPYDNDFFPLISPIHLLKQYILDVIYFTTKWVIDNDCPYHKLIVRRMLDPGDVIISFNYDLIIDFSLKRNLDWDEKYGYGWINNKNNSSDYFNIANLSFNNELNLLEFREIFKKTKYLLLKPHGSMNFYDRNSSKKILAIAIEKALTEYTPGLLIKSETEALNPLKITETLLPLVKGLELNGTIDKILPFIIYPSPYKNISNLIFSNTINIWKIIYDALKKADTILAIGYSFSDLYFNEVICSASGEKSKKTLTTIVTKDELDFKKISSKISYFNLAIEPFYGFEEYIKSVAS